MDVTIVGRAVVVLEGAWIQERLRLIYEGFGSTVGVLTVELMCKGATHPLFLVVGGSSGGDCMLHLCRTRRTSSTDPTLAPACSRQ